MQKMQERRRKHDRHFTSIELGNQGRFRIGTDVSVRIDRVKQGDAGPHNQFGFGKIGRQLAEVLDRERSGQRLFDVGEADLLPSLTACSLERRLCQRVGATYTKSIQVNTAELAPWSPR